MHIKYLVNQHFYLKNSLKTKYLLKMCLRFCHSGFRVNLCFVDKKNLQAFTCFLIFLSNSICMT
jgi:hypothetical protein